MKIGIILGTRPEIIKLSSIIRELKKQNLDYFVIHTNQHYSKEMDEIFFTELKLPQPDYNLGVKSGTHGYQTGLILSRTEKILIKEKPSIVLVQGDTNSTLAGALAAAKLNILVGHVEAGLRSYDKLMPEEKNRILTDHLSDFLFCPTQKQKQILLNEGIDKKNIHIVGNTIVDAVLWAKRNPTDILNLLGLQQNHYLLLTLHRAENVDEKKRLVYLINQISKLKDEKIIFPIHPRTMERLREFNLSLPFNVKLIQPVGFLDMITLEKNAKVILTDSGGVQEEACILKILCITLRTTTERPETIEVGANTLMSNNLLLDLKKQIENKKKWENPFGDGMSGKKILNIIQETLRANDHVRHKRI